MIEEIIYCIEIINLFEDRNLKNKEVKEFISNNNLFERARNLDKIKQEREVLESNNELTYYNMDYEKHLEAAVKVLDKDQASERYNYSFLDYVWRIEKLFWNYYLDAAKMWEHIQLLENDIAKMHLLKHIVRDLIVSGDINDTYFYIEKMPVLEYSGEETKSEGYLLLLEHFAKNSDFANFAKTLKNSNARKNRSDVASCKCIFVTAYSKQNPLDEILRMLSDKIFGLKYLGFAIHAYAKNKPYLEIKELLETNANIAALNYEDRVNILVNAYVHDRNMDNDEVAFNEIFNLIAPINRKIKSGDIKFVDSLFFELAMCVKYNKDWIVKCSKAIKHNSLKKELNVYIK